MKQNDELKKKDDFFSYIEKKKEDPKKLFSCILLNY